MDEISERGLNGSTSYYFPKGMFLEHDSTWIQWIPLLVSSSERTDEARWAENDK